MKRCAILLEDSLDKGRAAAARGEGRRVGLTPLLLLVRIPTDKFNRRDGG